MVFVVLENRTPYFWIQNKCYTILAYTTLFKIGIEPIFIAYEAIVLTIELPKF